MPRRTPGPLARNIEAMKRFRKTSKEEIQDARIVRMTLLLACCGGNKAELTRLIRSGVNDPNAAGKTGAFLNGNASISLLVANWVESLLYMNECGIELEKILFTPEGGVVFGGSEVSFKQVGFSEGLMSALNRVGITGVYSLVELTKAQLIKELKLSPNLVEELESKLDVIGGLAG